MINNSTQGKINNILLSLLVVLGIYAIGAYFFDFYYDLNDDMVIKDILSGVYHGSPDGHTNQMLYPIGFLISGIYCLLPKVPVFGIFLCVCLGLCFWMISYRMQSFFESSRVKIITTILMILVFTSLMIWELIYVQYSVVCGVLVGTACFWFYTTSVDDDIRGFWKKNIPALGLVWLAFLVRSEMMLLTSPFLAAAGMMHWTEAVKIEKECDNAIDKKSLWKYMLSKNSICKYVGFVGVIAAGIGILLGTDYLAYRGEEWQEYRGFFNARTQLYDYTWYPNYEEQKEFYEENGISEIQYRLIDNYNFGLDESITENTLEKVAFYGEKPNMLGSNFQRIKNSMIELVKRSFSLQDAPYNYFVLAGYGLVVGLAIVQKNREYIWKLLFLVVMRCIPWMYLIYVQRAVARIIHPLYIIEFLILLAMLVKQLYDRPLWNVEKYYRMIVAGVLAVAALIYIPFGYMKVNAEQVRREQIVEKQRLLDDYAKANPENYYYLDVYSTIHFVEKMFQDVDNSQKNYDLLGGWVCRSPLQKQNLKKYTTAATIEEAMLAENVYFVAEAEEDVAFMKDYYESKGKNVEMELQETIGEGENPFHVYKVKEEKKTNSKFPKKGR